MKSTFFVFAGFTLIAVSLHSCVWEQINPAAGPDVKAPGLVRRPGRPALRRKTYPMAQHATPQLLKQAAMSEVPSTEVVRAAVQGNGHYAPPALMDGLDSFSKMVDLARAGGENTEVAASFFKQCAESNTTVTAVRAVCLRHLWDLKGNDVVIAGNTYELNRIAARLPSILKPQ